MSGPLEGLAAALVLLPFALAVALGAAVAIRRLSGSWYRAALSVTVFAALAPVPLAGLPASAAALWQGVPMAALVCLAGLGGVSSGAMTAARLDALPPFAMGARVFLPALAPALGLAAAILLLRPLQLAAGGPAAVMAGAAMLALAGARWRSPPIRPALAAEETLSGPPVAAALWCAILLWPSLNWCSGLLSGGALRAVADTLVLPFGLAIASALAGVAGGAMAGLALGRAGLRPGRGGYAALLGLGGVAGFAPLPLPAASALAAAILPVWLMLAGYAGLRGPDEAAQLDGLGWFTRWRLALPVIRGDLVMAGLMAVLQAVAFAAVPSAATGDGTLVVVAIPAALAALVAGPRLAASLATGLVRV